MVILEKKTYFRNCSHSFSKKLDIISDVIISISAIIKTFFYHILVKLQSMTAPNFISKAFSYQNLRRGTESTICPPRGMIRQNYLGADKVNDQVGNSK